MKKFFLPALLVALAGAWVAWFMGWKAQRQLAETAATFNLTSPQYLAIRDAPEAGPEALLELWNRHHDPLTAGSHRSAMSFIRVLTSQKRDAEAFDLLATIPLDGLNGIKVHLLATFWATCSLDFVAAMEPDKRYPAAEEKGIFGFSLAGIVYGNSLSLPTAEALMEAARKSRDPFIKETCLVRAGSLVKNPDQLAALLELSKTASNLDTISGSAFSSLGDSVTARTYAEDLSQPEPVRLQAVWAYARWLVPTEPLSAMDFIRTRGTTWHERMVFQAWEKQDPIAAADWKKSHKLREEIKFEEDLAAGHYRPAGSH